MLASELVTALQALIHKHGDLLVVDENDSDYSDPEYNDDINPVFVLEAEDPS